MSPLLKEYLGRRVVLITTSGECYIATLEGFDRNTNLIVSNVCDRFDKSQGVLSHVQLFRGSEVVACGLYEPDKNTDPLEGAIGVHPLRDTKNIIENEHVIWTKVFQQNSSQRHKRRKVAK